jgi:hypothetical protein
VDIDDYADTMRALGRYLDQVGASDIVIIEEPTHLGVVWKGRASTREARLIGGVQLHALRTTARMFRGLEGAMPRLLFSELLRTLGSVADDARATRVVITETSDGFRLSAHLGDQELTNTYAYSEVVASAQERYRHRSGNGRAHDFGR